jgi:hypothetical protein
MTDLREALNHWKCAGCGGSGKYQQDAKGRARAEARGKIPDPKFQPDPVTCKVCNGDGLNPIASAALREPLGDARGELLFGDLVECHSSSLDNPTRYGYFVRRGVRTGALNPGAYVELTDGRGKFWTRPMDGSIEKIGAMDLRPAPVPQCEAEPDAQDAIKPHLHVPDLETMGDCRVCGHPRKSPWHIATPPSRSDAESAQAMEYARRLNDIAVNCEIAAFEGDASDLRRIAEWLAAIVPPPSEAGREKLAKALCCPGGCVRDVDCVALTKRELSPHREDQIDAILALSPDPGTVAVASAKPVIDPNDPNNESPN